jgi:hypothetical protein
MHSAMVRAMWNGTAFCDGVCSEVKGASLVMTNIFTLAFGLVPPAHMASVWSSVARWGLEQMGDYGAFWYQSALAGSYYAGPGVPPATPGDGTELLKALTKCDLDSWCAGLRDDALTMTRESWHDGTYSLLLTRVGGEPDRRRGVGSDGGPPDGAWLGLLHGASPSSAGTSTLRLGEADLWHVRACWHMSGRRPKLGSLAHAAITVPTPSRHAG